MPTFGAAKLQVIEAVVGSAWADSMEGSESEPSNTMQVEIRRFPGNLCTAEPSFVEDPPQTGESAEINVLHAGRPPPLMTHLPPKSRRRPLPSRPPTSPAAAPAAEDGDAEEWNGEEDAKCDMCLDKPKYGGRARKPARSRRRTRRCSPMPNLPTAVAPSCGQEPADEQLDRDHHRHRHQTAASCAVERPALAFEEKEEPPHPGVSNSANKMVVGAPVTSCTTLRRQFGRVAMKADSKGYYKVQLLNEELRVSLRKAQVNTEVDQRRG